MVWMNEGDGLVRSAGEPEQRIPAGRLGPAREGQSAGYTASVAWAYGAGLPGLIDSGNGKSAPDLGGY